MADELSPDQERAREQLNDLLQSLAEHLGPWDEDEDGTIDVAPPCFVDGWVLVANWVDSTGSSFIVRIPSAHLPIHARSGLLHEALHGF